MGTPDFTRFYRAVHGWDPFPWQVRLADRAAAGEWPATIALPTSAGKTSALDAAVYALAVQAGRPALERTAPLRIVYVIDRRLVVDEVTAHAQKLAVTLLDARLGKRDDPALQWVADRLHRFTEGDPAAPPLEVVAMRGGMFRNDAWALRPNQPLICVSTIDQAGSRLLFRGYGIPEYRRPIHAGLLGCDALYLVDEAHMAAPFCATLQAVARYQSWAPEPIAPPLRVVEMSATARDTTDSIELTLADRETDLLRRRLAASKPAVLMEAAAFEAEMVAQAGRLSNLPEIRVIGVVANRVGSARRIFQTLREQFPGQAILLTGRNRPYVRDQILRQYEHLIVAAEHRPVPPLGRLFVVATQTIEVGANLDFDALVTEAAPLSSLRQRFGRLNRLGRTSTAPAVIVRRKGEREDPIYGGDLARTWDWLVTHSRVESQGRRQVRYVDFGIDALAALLDQEALGLEQPPGCPVLLPAHVDLWVQTSPTPYPDPDVAPFLHGPETGDAVDVQVVWRADLDSLKPDAWREVVELAPPLLREAMPVPLWAVRRWLRAQAEAGEISDLGGGVGRDGEREPGAERQVLIWRGPRRSRIDTADSIAPGDTIVVPAAYGGADDYGWDPAQGGPVLDCGDACALERAARAPAGRRTVRLRLYPGLWAGETQAEQAWSLLQESLELAQAGAAAEPDAALDYLLEQLPERLFPGSTDKALFQRRKGRRIEPYPNISGLVVTVPLPADWSAFSGVALSEIAADETDDEDLPPGTGLIALSAHQQGVAEHAARFARGCGLGEHMVEALANAGLVHDLGKVEDRFQLLLAGGDPRRLDVAAEPLAKSPGRHTGTQVRRLQAEIGYPRGFRHEILSVALLQSQPALLAGWTDPDLVLYLVGAHHGRGRPQVPAVADPEPQEVEVSVRGHALRARTDHGLWRLDSGWPDRYWRLVRRYGPWGLAYLEAICRLADGAQSRQEEEGAGQDGTDPAQRA